MFLGIVWRPGPHPHTPAFSILCLFLKQADLIAGRPELAAIPCILVKGQRVHNAGAVEHQGL